MNIFITGGTGFIGSHLIPALILKQHTITCLVRSDEKGKALQSKQQISYIVGDITDVSSLQTINPTRYDAVIHLAAMGHVSAVTEEAFRTFTTINEGGTKNLISIFSKNPNLKCFLHFSSTAAMGPIEQPILDETSIPNPITPYQKSKLASETYSLNEYKQNHFPTIVIRPCMVYGSGGYGEFYKFCKLMKKGIFPKVGLGKNLTPLVHVSDVVQGTIAVLEHGLPGEIYLITSERSIAMDEMRHYIMNALNKKAPYLFVPVPLAYAGAWILEHLYRMLGQEPIVTYRNIRSTVIDRTFDIKKAKKLGYSPSISFQNGITETVHWFQQQGKI